jgi:hypothetical protein
MDSEKAGHLSEEFFGVKFSAMQNRDQHPAGHKEREQPHLLLAVSRVS